MGGLKDILEIIPQLLLYFVPGFICFKMKAAYWNERKAEEMGCVVYSILYSYIVYILYMIIKALIPSAAGIVPQAYKQIVKIVFFLLLGVLLGLVMIRFHKFEFWETIWKHFHPDSAHVTTVWEKAMRNSKGAEATVYLKGGLIYEGELVHYTNDPDDDKRELLLYNYKTFVQKEKNDTESGYRVEIKKSEDRTNVDEMEKVYISQDEIIAVEIKPNIDAHKQSGAGIAITKPRKEK